MEFKEEWKDIKGYEGSYQVSNLGRVKSLEKRIEKSNNIPYTKTERIIKQVKNKKNGFLQVMLIDKDKEPHFKLCYVHRLVAMHFCENPYNLDLVSHINGDDIDNRSINLRFISKSPKTNKKLNLI